MRRWTVADLWNTGQPFTLPPPGLVVDGVLVIDQGDWYLDRDLTVRVLIIMGTGFLLPRGWRVTTTEAILFKDYNVGWWWRFLRVLRMAFNQPRVVTYG